MLPLSFGDWNPGRLTGVEIPEGGTKDGDMPSGAEEVAQCLHYYHKDPQSYSVVTHACNPRTGKMVPASLGKLAKSQASERPCFINQGGWQLTKTPGLSSGLHLYSHSMHLCTLIMCTYRHITCTHVYILHTVTLHTCAHSTLTHMHTHSTHITHICTHITHKFTYTLHPSLSLSFLHTHTHTHPGNAAAMPARIDCHIFPAPGGA